MKYVAGKNVNWIFCRYIENVLHLLLACILYVWEA